jgi:ureidoglycolate lyase
MRLATFRAADGDPEIGVLDGDQVVSLARAAPRMARDMQALIAGWPTFEKQVRHHTDTGENRLDLADLRLMAPVPRPGKIFAIGLNYRDHIAETSQPTPEHQVWTTKAVTAVTGPFDDIHIPPSPAYVDYEAELVVIVGTGGRNLTRADARDAVFGYCVGNDVTERSWQTRTPQWVLGKSFDTHAPFGPWITTADGVPDPHALGIRTRVNDEPRQDSTTADMLFDTFDMIEHLSQATTLEPGDVIFTGTPGGIGAARNPAQFLHAGDRVRIEIDTLGTIENICRDQPPA